MKTYLKIKIKSLAEEARIIRAEEKKWPGQSEIRTGLHLHRVGEVRRESRVALLAYGFLRGRARDRIEKSERQPDWDRVQKLIEKYGTEDRRLLAQRFAAWKEVEPKAA